MNPVLDHDIPCGKRRTCDQICYVPNHYNSMQEYLHNGPVRKRSYWEHSSTILESLLRHVKMCFELPPESTYTALHYKKDEVVTDDFQEANKEV